MISIFKTQSDHTATSTGSPRPRPFGITHRLLAKVLLASVVFTSAPVLASGAQADSGFNDYYATFVAHTCAKLVRLADAEAKDREQKGRPGWRPSGSINIALIGSPKMRKLNFAPANAPEWATDMFSNLWVETHVVIYPRDALYVDAKCYIRPPATRKWRQFGTATFYGNFSHDQRSPNLSPLLSGEDCGTLLTNVINNNLWEPSRTSTGAFRSVSRDFTGLESILEGSVLSDSWAQPLVSPIRLSGVATKHIVTARQKDASTITATCFVYDKVTNSWLTAGTTSRAGVVQLPKSI